MDQTTDIERLIGELEVAVDRLRSLYEQYFMGIEKLEPMVPRKDVDRRIHVLRKEQIRNTALRFRFQMLLQRYNTFQTHWQRICRDIENGTYKRHVIRARQRFGAKRPSAPPPASPPSVDPAFAAELAELDREFAPAEVLADIDVEWEEEGPTTVPSVAPRPPTAAARAKASPSVRAARAAPRTTPPPRTPKPSAPSSSPIPAPPSSHNLLPSSRGAPPSSSRLPDSRLPDARTAAPTRGAGASPPRPAAGSPPAPAARASSTAPARAQSSSSAPPSSRSTAAPASRAHPPSSRSPSSPRTARPAAARGASPAPPSRPTPAPKREGDLPEDRVKQLYRQYIETKRRQNESTAAITYDAVARSLRESSAKLKQKLGRSVDFEVAVKDGRAILRPVLK